MEDQTSDTTAETVPDIYVKCVCGAYETNSVRGKRSSCTHSAQAAAERQATKLYGDRVYAVQEVKEGNQFTTRWRVVLKAAEAGQQAS